MSEMLRMLRRGYELIWREGRVEDAVAALGPDVEWVVPGHPDGDVRRGSGEVVSFFRDWIEQFDDLDVRWELYDVGEGRALAIISTEGRGRFSGVPVSMRFAQLWSFRDGRVVRMVLHPDVDAALAVAPLLARSLEGFATYQREGVDAVLGFHTDDVIWEEDPDWPDGQVWHGHEGIRSAFRERLDSTAISAELEGGVARGERVLLLMRWSAEGQGSGATAADRAAVIHDFEGPLVKRVRFFLDRERARAAFEAA